MGRPDGSWFWTVEPSDASPGALRAGDGRWLTRRDHGSPVRAEVRDESGEALPVATALRAIAALPRTAGAPLTIRLGPRGTDARRAGSELTLDGPWVASAATRHAVADRVRALGGASLAVLDAESAEAPHEPIPTTPFARRVLFFESLMNTDMPHNDTELSQGVLHMASALRGAAAQAGAPCEAVFANVKMSITDRERPHLGIDTLERALAGGPLELVCITLLEGYWDGVVSLVRELRRLGSRAHVAVGGVMPSLAPEHVAAHLPDVSFVCRGAGEYFVPRLAAILGPGASIDAPFSAAQRQALTSMQGLIAIDRASRTVISARSSITVSAPDLDSIPLDLSLLTPRHLENGVEISTARGCIHKCTFCSILGRQSYQARSADGVLALLERYAARYREMYPDGEIPRNAFRLHISDDDFACDKERAAQFLRALPSTPFRLASIQVSIADLCKRVDGVLLPEPDPAIVDAITAECFADAHAALPARDFVADHRSRRWSAYLAIGVETFSDAELRRLGKGYRVEHVRAMVDALARKRIHMDAYFIASNAETTLDDLIDSVAEVCRLKIRYPRYFHVRFPIVPRLVSYATSASHRRMQLRGETDRMHVHAVASVPSHPELDYPFVDHDESRDPYVRAAVAASFFTDERRYTASLEALRKIVRQTRATLDDPEQRRAGERAARRLDDLSRRLAFDALAEARAAARQELPGAREAEATVLESAEAILGPRREWLRALKHHGQLGTRRLVVIPTWQCELRCSYCWIPKQDGRVMSAATLERSIELLLGSDRRELMLQFFGGEALIEWELVRHGIEHGTARARERGKELSFVLSSNGWSLDEDKLAWLARHRVKLELSLDGDPETQNVFRIARDKDQDSYRNGIAPRAPAILAAGLPYEVIMVVHPKNASKVAHNFFHVAGLGFERVQINFALGPKWLPGQMSSLAAGLLEIGEELRRRWATGSRLVLVNLERRPQPILLNGEVTVDFDGTIYGGNGFLHETKNKDKFVVGHLDDESSFDRYDLDMPANEYLLEWSYPPEETKNNLEVGKIMASFVAWMQEGEHVPPARRGEATPPTPPSSGAEHA